MKINLNESKTLDFNMDTSGCSAKDLQGFLRFNFEGVEYGFPAKFEKGGLKVDIPPFKKIVNEEIVKSFKKLKEINIESRLDVVVKESMHVVPWSGFISLELPVSIKVKEEKEEIPEEDRKALSEEFNKVFKSNDEEKVTKIKDLFDGKIKIDEKEEEEIAPELEEEDKLEEDSRIDKDSPAKSRLFEALNKKVEKEEDADIT
jgi:hypothetical protein